MAKLLRKAVVEIKKLNEIYNMGDIVKWRESFHDGRSYEIFNYVGEIIQINKVTVDVKISNGNIYRVNQEELMND